MVDVSIIEIKNFLDAADNVLNSNTFLFDFEASGHSDTKDFEKSLEIFLKNHDFQQQFFKQDIDRDWLNWHIYEANISDIKTKENIDFLKMDRDELIVELLTTNIDKEWKFDFKPKKEVSGHLVKPDFKLKISKPAVDKREYLTAMLMGNSEVGRFPSWYHKNMNRLDSEAIVNSFLSCLTKSNEYELYCIQPDFLFSNEGISYDEENLYYFNGEFASNSATVIACTHKSYLLLTNGIN